MGNPVPVHAGWAIWSKQPGTRDDYSVLASSDGPLSSAEFTRVLAHFAAGNPPAESGTPASLPWVVLSRVGVADQPYLGVSVQVPADYVDGTGRPVSRTSYLCVPYEDVARAPVSYRRLAQAVRATPLPGEGGALVSLVIPPLDPGELARDVIEFGPVAVAATAALLLSGPVTITGPEFPDTETRVRFLDAVAALLPYGYRASLTAATWSDTAATGQRFRIVFALRARDEASRVPWRAAVSVPGTGAAGTYLEHLRRVLGRPAVDPLELERLIRYLAADTGPRKFEQPQHAVASLNEFFRAAVVAAAIDAGRATEADIRLLFDRDQDVQLSPDRRRAALGQLIAAADAQDWPLISRRFGEIAADDPQSLLHSLAAGGLRLLWSGAAQDHATGYLRLAARYDLADDLLARLVAPPEAAADLVTGFERVGALLADFALGDAASYPRTQQAVGGQPAAGAALITHLSAGTRPERVSAAVEWLEPVLDRVLPAFNAVLGHPPESVDLLAVKALEEDGGRLSVQYLLRAASYRKRLRFVLPALATWLVWQRLSGAAVDGRSWVHMARELTPATADEAAWLDLTLLATGNDPRMLFAGQFPRSQFSPRLAAAWQQLASHLAEQAQAADDLLTGALIDALGRHPWRDDKAQAGAVMDMTGWLTADGARPRLKAVVQDAAQALRHLPRGAPAGQIAAACARAQAAGLTAEEASEALARSGVIDSGARAADVLEHLRRDLRAAAARGNHASSWITAFAGVFAAGTFGQPVAADFSVAVLESSFVELRYHLSLLQAVAGNDASDSAPVVSEQGLELLANASEDMSDLVQVVRKRQRKWRIPGRRGGAE